MTLSALGQPLGAEAQSLPLRASDTDALQEEIRGHDRYQVEIKLDYDIKAGAPTSYLIDTYLFIPASLGISSSTYSREHFYGGIQNYLRLKPVESTIENLASGGHSALARIEAMLLEKGSSGRTWQTRHLEANLKLLCAVYQEALSLEFRSRPVSSRDEPSRKDGASDAVVEWIERLIGSTQHILGRYRSLAGSVESDDPLEETWRLVDERLSLLTESALLKVYGAAQVEIRSKEKRAKWKKVLRDVITEEGAYRARLNPSLVLNPDDDNEAFMSRSSYLKKFASSVLYLSTWQKQEGETLEHIFYAFAAGIAMAFATIITFYAQSVYGTTLTFPVFAALVVGYMFKDRIKEIARTQVGRHLRPRLRDRRTTIGMPQGRGQLGYLRERMRFISLAEVPPDVVAARREAATRSMLQMAGDVVVIRYTKEVAISRGAFEEIYGDHPAISGISDILRYDVRPFLHKMDDPVETRLYLDGDHLRAARCRKTYPVDVVLHSSVVDSEAPASIEWSRLVLNRKGIRRMERM